MTQNYDNKFSNAGTAYNDRTTKAQPSPNILVATSAQRGNLLYEEVRRNSDALTAEEIIRSMQRFVDEINVELSKR